MHSILIEGDMRGEGFRIGFDRRSPLRSAGANMPSAKEQAEVVDEYSGKECSEEGRMLRRSR